MTDYSKEYAEVQRVFDTLNVMVQQIIDQHERRAHIAADMHALVTETLPVVEARGWRDTAAALRCYRVYWLSLVPEPAQV